MTCKNRYMYANDCEMKQPKYTVKGVKVSNIKELGIFNLD